jgi:hypothetical protein
MVLSRQRYASEFDDMPLKSAEGRKKAEEAVRAIFKKR